MTEENTPLEELKTKLNRWPNVPPIKRSTLSPETEITPDNWPAPAATAPVRLLMPKLKKILLISFVFFLTMLGLAAWIFYRGDNLVGAGNIDLEIIGPKTARAGEVVTFNLNLTNQNTTPLTLVDLTVEYPPGTYSVVAPGQKLSREQFSFGTMQATESRKQTLRAILFGEEHSTQEIKIITEYRLADSNALFTKTTTYPIQLTEAPVSLDLVAPTEAVSGQEITFSFTISSAAKTEVKKPTLLLHYPLGFQFKRASFAPSYGNNVWELATLTSGQKSQLEVVGVITGQEKDSQALRAEIGGDYQTTDESLKVLYDSAIALLTVRQPLVTLGVEINSQSGSEYFATNRELLQTDLFWVNNLAEALRDVQIIVSFAGEALDRQTISPVAGFYRASDGAVIWNKTNETRLAELAPGDQGKVRLSFAGASLLANGQTAPLINPQIILSATLKGKRILTDGSNETPTVEVTSTRTIKFTSVAQLAAKAVYVSGPRPLKVGVPTTYRIEWSLVNSSNDLSEARVQATMPPTVSWLASVAPTNEPVEFVAAEGGGGTVIWSPGSVSVGTGSKTVAREVSFLVALTPEPSQMNTTPVLLSAPEFSALDTFTHRAINQTLRHALDTTANVTQ